ncbi:MAG: NAD(P)-dependent oxidoreductase [Rhodocyclales bacterium GT-UBC]|nr:MAG: NAD(P)-dependent oxidoreductase [Rhodocyclales bacterium GT-UBC]
MSDALIGYSGFVGGSLLKQRPFDDFYRSANIHAIRGKKFETIVCSAAPAQKWIANKNPDGDAENINALIEQLKTVRSEKFILISTVDVFKHPIDVHEDSPVDETGLHPYGLHRRHLERFVEQHFPGSLIVRLPGLVGPGLRKNIIFDFLNKNNLGSIDSKNIFQFYPMVNLWHDIQTALSAGLKRIHLTAEPISVEKVASTCFGMTFKQTLSESTVRYDMKTNHAELFGVTGPYQYRAREAILAIRAYAQSEAVSLTGN